jgi:hypothetical protein
MRRFVIPLALVACNPVHSDQVDALGGEAAGVRKGPLHRPGQPCLLCHDGALGDPPEFSVAGTVYQTQDKSAAASGAVVTLTGSDGRSTTTTTNQAGNFYLSPGEFTPAYPMKVSVTYGSVKVDMTSRIGRDGSCGTCHTSNAGPSSAGPVFVPKDGVIP